MSSILKALHKLESESLHKGTGQSWPHNFYTGEGPPETQGQIGGRHIFALICIGLVISGSAIYFFSKDGPAVSTSVSEPQPEHVTTGAIRNDIFESRNLSTDKTVEAKGTDKTIVKSSKPSEIQVTQNNDKVGREIALDSVHKENARKPKHGGIPLDTTDPNKNEEAYTKQPYAYSSQPTSMEPSNAGLHQEKHLPNLATGAINKTSNVIEAEIIHSSQMKLHAISWTSDINTRIAVINGSIVREGQKIGGYLVFKINKDDILLQENGDLFRLVFSGH